MVEIFERSLTFPSPPVTEKSRRDGVLSRSSVYPALKLSFPIKLMPEILGLSTTLYMISSPSAFKGLGLYLDFGKEPCVFKKTFQVLRQELR